MKKLFAFAAVAAALSLTVACTPTMKKRDYLCTITTHNSHGVVKSWSYTKPLENATEGEKAAFEYLNTKQPTTSPEGITEWQTCHCE